MAKLLINHNREKLLNLITFFVNNTKNCNKTKLFKLLACADFDHVKETGKSITGLEYYAWKYGPVPKELFSELKNPSNEFKNFFVTFELPEDDFKTFKIVPKADFNENIFTKREMKIIKRLVEIYGPVPGSMMVKCTHAANGPWDIVYNKGKGEWQHIDYILALDSSKESITKEEYQEKQQELKILQSISDEK